MAFLRELAAAYAAAEDTGTGGRWASLQAMRAIFFSSAAGRISVAARMRFTLTEPFAYSLDWKNEPPSIQSKKIR